MKNYVFAVVVLILTYGCGSDDSDSPQGASTTEIEGAWEVIETDTNINSIIIIQDTSFSFNSQLSGESYEGEIHGSMVDNTYRLNVRVTQTSDSQYLGQTSLCIYTVNSDASQSTLACNPPGHSEYPTDYVPTNLTRVFDLTKLSSEEVTSARLIGNWSTNCSDIGGNKTILNFINATDLIISSENYLNNDCTGDITGSTDSDLYTYSIGNAVIATDNEAGASLMAYELDFIIQDQPFFYGIAYIDDSGILYLGETTPLGQNGSSPALRPNVINLLSPSTKLP